MDPYCQDLGHASRIATVPIARIFNEQTRALFVTLEILSFSHLPWVFPVVKIGPFWHVQKYFSIVCDPSGFLWPVICSFHDLNISKSGLLDMPQKL